MISPFLPIHDADSITLDFGVFIAERARTYRTSQAAIIAALVPVITPSQPAPPLASAADTSTMPPVDEATDGAELSSSRPPEPSVAPIPDAPKPFPAASGLAQPTEAKTSDQADGGAISAVKGANARLENADGVEPPPSAPQSPALPPNAAAIMACHKAHPDWPAKMIIQATGLPRGTVSGYVSKLGLVLPSQRQYDAAQAAKTTAALKAPAKPETPPEAIPAAATTISAPPKPPTRRELLRQAHSAHPEWTSKELAAHLGISMENVCAVAKQTGITLPRAGRSKAERQQVTTPKPAPATPAQRVGPPIVTARQPVTVANEPRRVVPTHAPIGAGPSTRFYVRDDKGRYLHQSLERSPTDTGPLMTINRKWAWCDNANRFAGACRKWPEIADMRKEVPQP